jgi:hypothetical protein
MNKLSFRAKALDPGKAMPVFLGDEIPDLSDFAAVNRAVPEIPTGMEKEEEMVGLLYPLEVNWSLGRHFENYIPQHCVRVGAKITLVFSMSPMEVVLKPKKCRKY